MALQKIAWCILGTRKESLNPDKMDQNSHKVSISVAVLCAIGLMTQITINKGVIQHDAFSPIPIGGQEQEFNRHESKHAAGRKLITKTRVETCPVQSKPTADDFEHCYAPDGRWTCTMTPSPYPSPFDFCREMTTHQALEIFLIVSMHAFVLAVILNAAYYAALDLVSEVMGLPRQVVHARMQEVVTEFTNRI